MRSLARRRGPTSTYVDSPAWPGRWPSSSRSTARCASACPLGMSHRKGPAESAVPPPGPEDSRKLWPDVPGYEILDVLGSGGMGVVYRALDKNRGAEVALKAVRQESPAAIVRFKQEFRGLLEVVHTNLVRLYELDLP